MKNNQSDKTDSSDTAEQPKRSKTKRVLPVSRVVQPSLADVAQQALRQMIVRGELAPGERLVEPELGEALGISRTPLRDALKTLAAEGLVQLRRNRNSIVAPIDAEQLAHLFEVEAGMEGMAAVLACERMTNTEIKRLEVLQDRMERLQSAGDLDGYFELNQKMHEMIVAGSKNPVLIETHGRLIGQLERARFAALTKFGRWEESTSEHRMILEALKARDSAKVQELVMNHVSHTGEVITDICDAFSKKRRRA